MQKTTQLRLPESGKFHHYFFISDLHSKFLSKASFDIMLQHALLIPPEERACIIGGDFAEADFLMARDAEFKINLKAKRFEEYFVPLAEDEFFIMNAILNDIQRVFGQNVFYMMGNHDWRYDWFRENHVPHAYKHNFDISKQLHLEKRGVNRYEYNDWLDVGSLALTHGTYCGVSALKRHSEVAQGKNVMFGHVHQAESKAFPSRGRTKKAWSNPCMSGMNPEYMKNRPNNWTDGYSTVHMKSNGHFNLFPHEVFDDELILSSGHHFKYENKERESFLAIDKVNNK